MSKTETTTPQAAGNAIQKRFGGYYQSHDVEPDRELTEVGPGTPGGEYLRRTWQPVCLSNEVGDLPLSVQMLGEPLVVFRSRAGAIGLLARQCSHRGTSLEYGLPTDEGIQCCYHGWHFAIDGTILETPNDPSSRIKERICHPAYPTHEHDGIIFAWMGHPDEMPDFPHLDAYVQPETEAVPFSLHFPCNWVQLLDNTQDPTHSCFLHTRVTGPQFSISWGGLPEIEYLRTPIGQIALTTRRWKDKVWVRTTDVMMPNLNQTGALWLTADDEENFGRPALTRWMRPIDDTSTQMIGWRWFNDRNDREGKGDKSQVGYGKIDFIGQTEHERPYKERQAVPGDFEAIAGQGPVAMSPNWNLNGGDRGVAMMRNLIRENIRALRAGEDYMTVERARRVENVVPTYVQDTIVTSPAGNGDDRALMRKFAKQVWQIVVDSAELREAEREDFVADQVRKVMQAD